MKFDKDMVLKHRFWIGIAVAYPLAVVAIGILLTSVSGSITAERNRIKGDLEKVKKVPPEVYNKDGIAKYTEMSDKAISKQTVVWNDAYKAQADLYTWPDLIEQKYEFADGYHVDDIKVLKEAKDAKDWPEDGDKLMHGIIRSRDNLTNDYFIIENRQGKPQKFHRAIWSKVEGGSMLFRELDGQVGKPLAISYQRGRYFGDKMRNEERTDYTKSYREQILPILELVEPQGFDERGNVSGVVQLRGWSYHPRDLPLAPSFFKYVETDWVGERDISDEAWMAQEDLWVQREIYRLIGSANNMVAKLERQDLGQAAKPTTARYTNPYFTLDLKLTADELEVVVTNRLKRRQKLDQDFLIRFQEKSQTAEKVRFGEQPLDPAGTVDGKGNRLDTRLVKIALDRGPARTGIYDVKQVLTWETAAVRRIDQLVFAHPSALSHRTCHMPLLPYKVAGQGEGGPPGGPGGPAMPGGPIGPGGPGFGPGVGPGGPGFGPAGAAGPFGGGEGRPMAGAAFGPPGAAAGAGVRGYLPNGFWAERYIEVTPQARRIPVALALIVDQDHVDRVLTTFNNSALRFLTTQVLINHYAGSLRPQPSSAVPGGPGAGFPFAGGPGGFMPGGLMPGGLGGPGETAAPDMEANLELVIYGIVTLYERFPPKPAPSQQAAPPVDLKGPAVAPRSS
jgi:hypothetical protein